MAGDFVLRAARADDFEQIAALADSTADTGRIPVKPRYLRNPVEAFAELMPELEWVVAESDGRLIGGAQIIHGETEVEGHAYPGAVLSSLMVHPDHRRRGVATALTQWRLERAGPDAVVAAAIQHGNEGSVANARKWATQIYGKLALAGFRAAGRPPRSALELREPRDDAEWDEAAAGLARFEEGWNLRTPETGASLRDRTERTLGGERFQRYFLAVEDDRLVGGYQLQEGGRLASLVFEHIPLNIRALNVLLRIIPPDRELRSNALSRVWFAPGRDDVARDLWRHACSLSAATGNAIGTQFDTRGPLRKIFPLKPWTPKGEISVAVRSPVKLDEDRLLSPP
jgi:GNAT superfamily N-acetyltransferase